MIRDKVIEIFVKVYDSCKEIRSVMEEKLIEDRKLGKRNRKVTFVKGGAYQFDLPIPCRLVQ